MVDQAHTMVITLPNGKVFEGSDLGTFRNGGVEYKMMDLRPMSKDKYLVVRRTQTNELSWQIITGCDNFVRFYRHIQQSTNVDHLVSGLLGEAKDNRGLDWKEFYDQHYPEFVYGGVTWQDFKSNMLGRTA